MNSPRSQRPESRTRLGLAALVVATSLVGSGLTVLPAMAAPPTKTRPGTAGLPLKEPHASKALGGKGLGKVALPGWKVKQSAPVKASKASFDLEAGPGAASSGPVTVKRGAKASGRANTATASLAPVTNAAFGAVVIQVASDQADQVTLSADTAALGVSADRARLYQVSGCDAGASGSLAGCATTAVPGQSVTGNRLTAPVQASPAATTFALAASGSGATGDFTATPTSPSSSWTAGGSSGDFTWSYPLDTPSVLSGMEPELGLSYSSSVVDGRTSSANNQASWVGEGFDLGGGGISRSYLPCSKDMTGSNTTTKTGDLCWGKNEALSVSFGTHSGELVQMGSSGTYRLRNDDGSRYERKTGASNGVTGGEYWILTTKEGDRLTFGNTGTSAWTVPVAGNNAGEPGYNSSFGSSFTTQAWSWKLSSAVDVHGNKADYTWATEANKYGKNNGQSGVATYVRGGYLTQIDYGMTAASSTATARIIFTTADRCASTNCALTTVNQGNWPDVPVDLICNSDSTCPTQTSPAFFSLKKLAKVTTQVRNSATAFANVDSWAFSYQFPDPGDGTRPSLWLSKTDHTVAGDSTVLSTSFAGMQMANRVDGAETALGAVADPFNKYRVVTVNTDQATQVNVVYTSTECTPSSVASIQRANNSARCFPAQYQPVGYDTTFRHWFHRYAVAKVTVNDLTGASNASMVTQYSYGSPAWRWNDAPGTPDADRDWSVFAGYASVTTTSGDGSDGPQSKAYTSFYRGLNGDKAATGTKSVSVDGNGSSDTDDWWKAGATRESITYNGAAVVSRTVTTVGALQTAATNADGRVSGSPLSLNTKTFTSLAAGGVRTTEVGQSLDGYGNVTQVDDRGDVSTSGDDVCTKTSYAVNTSAWIVNLPQETRARVGSCPNWPGAPTADQVVGDTRYTYDNAAIGSVTKGLVTKTEQVTSVTGGTPSYQTTGQASYDGLGRPVTSTDALGLVTTTSYTADTNGRPSSVTVTGPDPDGAGPLTALVATSTLEPVGGRVTKLVAAGGETTEATYDAWGRVTQVWSPLMPKASFAQAPSVRYSYQVPQTGKPGAVKTETFNAVTAAYVASVAFQDGFGRERESQTQTIDSYVDVNGAVISTVGRLVSGTDYDSRGLAVTSRQPVLVKGAPDFSLAGPLERDVESYTKTTYDAAARPVQSSLYSKGQLQWVTSTTSYGGDRVTETPAQGKMPTTTVTDARGNTVQALFYKNRDLTGGYDTYSYSYNAKNQLASMKDAGGNSWTYGYDLMGRTVSVKDPNADAPTLTSYDIKGQTTSTTDPNGNVLAFTYDNLGRKTSVRQGSVAGAALSSWGYDSVKKGYQDTTTRYINGAAVVAKTLSFNAAGQPLNTQMTIPTIAGVVESQLAGSYTANYTYLLDGKVKTLATNARGPLAAETLTYGYDKVGRPLSLSGKNVYLSQAIYDGLGQLTQTVQLAATDQTAWWTAGYEPATGRLKTARIDRQLKPGADANLTYGYNQAGLLTSLSTVAHPDNPDPATGVVDTQCFSRDHLSRLTAAWSTSATSCGASPEYGGPASYQLSWAYDGSNNRTSQTAKTGATGSSTTSWGFAAAGGANPNRVSQVTVANSGDAAPVSTSYTYDAAGNTTQRWTGNAVNGGAGFSVATMSYNGEGRLSQVVSGGKTVGYWYGADGAQLVRRDDAKTTLFLGSTELVLDRAAGTVSATAQYEFGGRTVATRTGPGVADVVWVFSDLNNTGGWQVGASTGAVVVRRTTPFGEQRGTSASWRGSRGFVGGTVDPDGGFTRLGARDYDTFSGRFLTVDPVLDPASPLEWNPYQYGIWNPTSNPDPSGLKIC